MALRLEHPRIDRETAERYLPMFRDMSATHDTADMFGNPNPRPPKTVVFDDNLTGTGTHAYYIDPQEIIGRYGHDHPVSRKVRREVGEDPLVAFNPDIIEIDKIHPGYAMAVNHHEKSHGGQPGKMLIKQIYMNTRFGKVPLGEMIIEGANEYALERRGRKSPSRYMDKMSGGREMPLYSFYRDMAYELEDKSPGILRQIFRAAHRGGPNAVVRLMNTIPDLDRIVDKYVSKIAANYRTAPFN
jgi:hypothetical protein